ncbi:MAG: divergent polysaccharide deacetylase family protein [Alphaproteobacteria bacterium]|nr:divergent polysaccharide deacetylase family protein [Alphaproteobacteria bacterium]
MFSKFSIKAGILTFGLLIFALLAFSYPSDKTKNSIGDVLHSVTIPMLEIDSDIEISESVDDDLLIDDVPDDMVEVVEEVQEDIIIDKPRALVSVVIYDYGLSQKMSERIFETQVQNLTLSLSPYCETPSYWIDTAYRFESEPWSGLYVSVGDVDRQKDYGPLVIIEGSNRALNAKRLSDSLSRGIGGQGIIGYYDGTKPIKELTDVYKTLKSENISFSMISEVATFPSDDVLQSRYQLGYNESAENVAKFFAKLKKNALRDGTAFGAVPPTPLVLKYLSKWSDELYKNSIQIVPLSTLLDY